jgi:hypothetical protein
MEFAKNSSGCLSLLDLNVPPLSNVAPMGLSFGLGLFFYQYNAPLDFYSSVRSDILVENSVSPPTKATAGRHIGSDYGIKPNEFFKSEPLKVDIPSIRYNFT